MPQNSPFAPNDLPLYFHSMYDILKCDYNGAVCNAVRGGSVDEQYFPVVLFIMLYKLILTFEYAVEILK